MSARWKRLSRVERREVNRLACRGRQGEAEQRPLVRWQARKQITAGYLWVGLATLNTVLMTTGKYQADDRWRPVLAVLWLAVLGLSIHRVRCARRAVRLN